VVFLCAQVPSLAPLYLPLVPSLDWGRRPHVQSILGRVVSSFLFFDAPLTDREEALWGPVKAGYLGDTVISCFYELPPLLRIP